MITKIITHDNYKNTMLVKRDCFSTQESSFLSVKHKMHDECGLRLMSGHQILIIQ